MQDTWKGRVHEKFVEVPHPRRVRGKDTCPAVLPWILPVPSAHPNRGQRRPRPSSCPAHPLAQARGGRRGSVARRLESGRCGPVRTNPTFPALRGTTTAHVARATAAQPTGARDG